jgi:peptidyl-prolyl cis-trans isomerase SurA
MFSFETIAQHELVLDRIISVVGNNPILQSQLEAQVIQAKELDSTSGDLHCKVLEELLYQKLLVAQAKKDSVDVSDAQVEQELDRRISYYIHQFGSEERFVSFYGKSVEDYKTELRDDIKNILLAQQMQNKISGDITATPNDVKAYFDAIPEDSLPYISVEIEVGQLVKNPQPSEAAKKEARQKIDDIRTRIVKGTSTFATMAALYSEDPGSANKGGLYEHVQRGQFVPEWEAWAFKLKPNEVSDVFESVYGYFVIQLIQRRGNEVDARSLLIAPKVDMMSVITAKQTLDTIYNLLSKDSIKFANATIKYSDEGETKHNGGLIVNPFTGSTRFKMEELGQMDQTIAFAIEKLKVGEFTSPLPMTTHDGKQAYRILYLKSRTQPHRANLVDDYQAIQAEALTKKKHAAIQLWVKKKAADTYVRVADDYRACKFNNKWIIQ